MNRSTRSLTGLAALLATALFAGCAGTGEMTPKQKEAFELRRYCEQNPDDIVRCTGFLGDH
jgi:hypothetical protein